MIKSESDSYGSLIAKEKSLSSIRAMMFDAGARKLYVKSLAPNDNSKNQIYLGSDFSSLNIIPAHNLEVYESSSGKSRLKSGEKLIRGEIKLSWITPDGQRHLAPSAKLILYPQYPEVRFSGYLQGSSINMSEWMDVHKQGRALGRYLLFGICPDGSCLGYLLVPDANAISELTPLLGDENSVLVEIPLHPSTAHDYRQRLLTELKRIHFASPIYGKKLEKITGVSKPYKAANGACYTLEAELGITPNAYAEPDYDGWEVKAHGGSVVTLMTPEPNTGLYHSKGIDEFIRTYGYPDKNGVPDRLNFGGIHKIGERHASTGLTMQLSGYVAGSKKAEADGSLLLIDDQDNIAAEWKFTKLLEHWNRKHARAVYVPYTAEKMEDTTRYTYANHVSLGEGTDFSKLLNALSTGKVYYDPGIKLEQASTTHPKIKRRSQFRIHFNGLNTLYNEWEEVVSVL